MLNYLGARDKMVNKTDSIPAHTEVPYLWKLYELGIISKSTDSWFEFEVGILLV